MIAFTTTVFAFAEPTAALSDGGMLARYAWLIPVVPLVLMVGIVFFGKRLPHKGWELAEAAMLFVAAYGVALFVANATSGGIHYEGAVEIARVGSITVEWGWVVDGLSIMMYALVGVVGLAVFTYAKGYMAGDVRFTWFFAAFTLFAGAMLVLVSSANMIQLIVGWELVGVASYLLIGHYWEDHANNAAAIKAFLVNKVADVGLVIGVIVIGVTVGSFRFADVLAAVFDGNSALAQVAFWGGLALFIGAMGKSAQFPFHVWLPDAMAGPTPVSSLMHAATMVTAGIYLLGRMFPFYQSELFAADVKMVIIIVGALTLLLTGLIALVQDDIKKVLAYSTLSQLGYMTVAMGAGAYTAGLFHLFTHAFFKGLLFLAAGAMIHAVHSNNLSDMGGLRRAMPRTYATFLIGALALAGIFPLSGFWSKDEILASVRYDAAFGPGGTLASFVLVVAIVGAFVTALYMARAVYLAFFGEYKGHGEPHEAPRIMTNPLVALAGLSVVAGFANVPGLYDGFTRWLAARPFPMLDHHPESIDLLVAALGLGAALAGIALGTRLWRRDAVSQLERDRFRIPVLYPLLVRKYFIDDLYDIAIVRPIRGPVARFVNWTNTYIFDSMVNVFGAVTKVLSRVVYGGIDQRGIDLAINAIAGGTGEAGQALRYTTTGKAQQYVAAVFIGAVALVVGFLILT